MLRFWQPKRRKTGDDNFAEPETTAVFGDRQVAAPQPQGGRARRPPRPVSRTSSHGGGTSPDTPLPSVVFDNLCSSRDAALNPRDIRMLILDSEPRRALFDSATIIPMDGRAADGIYVSPCGKFQLLRKRKDVSMLAQLIWGAVPTPQGADALKFHHLIEDEKLLLSRVFSMPKFAVRDARGTTESLASSDSESQYMTTVRSLDYCFRNSLSSTAPPEQFARVRNSSLQLDSDDLIEERAFSPPHRLSKNRRIQMSHRTSLCVPAGMTQPIPVNKSTRSRLSSCGSSQLEEESSRQVALGIMLSQQQRAFLFQHIPIVETEMCRLESRITNAAMHPPSFLHNVQKAWEEFCCSLCMLYNSPRLKNPVWLSLAEKDLDDCQVAAHFCDQLASLVYKLDTKNTKFFLSNVVSTVLMNHMSWVASVATPNTTPAYPISGRSLLIGTTVNSDASSMPYNPHMAQYLEVSGSVGNTHRSTKTVVCGGDREQLAAILHVLSYFIRCSTVQQKAYKDDSHPLPLSQSFSPEAASPDVAASPPCGSLREMAFSPDKLADVDALSSSSLDSIPACVSSSLGGPVTNQTSFCPEAGSSPPEDCLGRSLMAGPSTTYSPHFVLSGLVKTDDNFNDAFVKILDDVRLEESAVHRAAAASLSSSQSSSSVCDAQLPDSVVVMADATDWSVKIVSADGLAEVHSPSEAVVSMLEQFAALHRVGCAPKFLVVFLEDTLSEILGKSLSLVEMVSGGSLDSPSLLSPDRVRSVIGCDHSDLRLILNVASVYYPAVLSSVM